MPPNVPYTKIRMGSLSSAFIHICVYYPTELKFSSSNIFPSFFPVYLVRLQFLFSSPAYLAFCKGSGCYFPAVLGQKRFIIFIQNMLQVDKMQQVVIFWWRALTVTGCDARKKNNNTELKVAEVEKTINVKSKKE